MAIKWYNYTGAIGTFPDTIRVTSIDRNSVIGNIVDYNDNLYGTKYNPLYGFYVEYGYAGNGYRYVYPENGTTLGLTTSDFYYRVFGVIDDGATISGSYHFTNDTFLANTTIKGRWRINDILAPTADNKSKYLLPIVNSVILKDGTVISNKVAGNKLERYRDNGYSGITFGDIVLGDDDGQWRVTEQYKDMIVDFGDFDQDVPSFFKTFIETNFEYIYPNTYTIKSPAGETLAQIDEQPPVKHTNLIQAGNSYQLSLTGTNDVVRTLTWEYDTHTNVVFEGLGTSPNGSVIIPVGEADITIEASTILYPIFRPYRPLPEVFGIDLYKNTAEANRVDKSNYLTLVRTLRGVMRESSSVTDLTITIQYPNYPDFNYVRIPELKRYYFVNDITIINANLYELDLSVDPLMSYKEAILGLTAFVDRAENARNPYIIDKKMVVQQGVDISSNTVASQVFDEIFNPETSVRFVMNGYKLSVRPNQL